MPEGLAYTQFRSPMGGDTARQARDPPSNALGGPGAPSDRQQPLINDLMSCEGKTERVCPSVDTAVSDP